MFERDFETLRMIRMEMVTEAFAETQPFKTQEFKDEVQPLIDELVKYRNGDCADDCEFHCPNAPDCDTDEHGNCPMCSEKEDAENKLSEAEDLVETLEDQIFELKEEVKTLQKDIFN